MLGRLLLRGVSVRVVRARGRGQRDYELGSLHYRSRTTMVGRIATGMNDGSRLSGTIIHGIANTNVMTCSRCTRHGIQLGSPMVRNQGAIRSS